MLGHLGVENEFPLGSLHETDLVYVFDNIRTTDSSILYLVLDIVLRTRLLVLKRSNEFNTKPRNLQFFSLIVVCIVRWFSKPMGT